MSDVDCTPSREPRSLAASSNKSHKWVGCCSCSQLLEFLLRTQTLQLVLAYLLIQEQMVTRLRDGADGQTNSVLTMCIWTCRPVHRVQPGCRSGSSSWARWTPSRRSCHDSSWNPSETTTTTRMWANAQRDGRPAKHRWHPLFNAAKSGWRSLLDCHAVTLPRRESHWNYLGCPKLPNRSQLLVGQSSPYCGGHVEEILLLAAWQVFFPIVDACLICKI